jgi:hypothetical protein
MSTCHRPQRDLLEFLFILIFIGEFYLILLPTEPTIKSMLEANVALINFSTCSLSHLPVRQKINQKMFTIGTKRIIFNNISKMFSSLMKTTRLKEVIHLQFQKKFFSKKIKIFEKEHLERLSL